MQVYHFHGVGPPALVQGDFHRLAVHISPNPGVLCLVDPAEELRARVERRREDLHGLEATMLSPGALGVLEGVGTIFPPAAEILDERPDTLQDAS